MLDLGAAILWLPLISFQVCCLRSMLGDGYLSHDKFLLNTEGCWLVTYTVSLASRTYRPDRHDYSHLSKPLGRHHKKEVTYDGFGVWDMAAIAMPSNMKVKRLCNRYQRLCKSMRRTNYNWSEVSACSNYMDQERCHDSSQWEK
jgi:hypothetical protein